MKLQIIIAVRGGTIQGIRATPHADGYDVTVVDYDNHECDFQPEEQTEAEFERELLGCTWEELEGNTEGIY